MFIQGKLQDFFRRALRDEGFEQINLKVFKNGLLCKFRKLPTININITVNMNII
jgi:hypothetical protein